VHGAESLQFLRPGLGDVAAVMNDQLPGFLPSTESLRMRLPHLLPGQFLQEAGHYFHPIIQS